MTRPASVVRAGWGVARRGPVVALAVLILLASLPDVASACPVCFDSSDENRMAFLGTTVFLSLLPLGMVAGAGLWIRKRFRELDTAAEDPDPKRPEA